MPRIVFDLDGTLVDSAPDIRATANAVLARHGASPLSLPETVSFIGSGAGVFVARMRAARDLPEPDEPAMLEAFMALYEDNHALTRPYPGVPETLAALRDAGHRLAICTNKPARPAHALLDHLGLGGHFEALIGGDTLPVRKPDPAPLRAALDALGGDGPALYAGDSEIDAATAQAACVPFLLFTEGYRRGPADTLPAAARFSDFAALPDLVATIAAPRRAPS